MRDRPSRTAYKVALNLVTLGSKPGMDRALPPGSVEATARLLVASGAVGERTVRWARTRRAVSVYEAFDWMLPGQFEAFAHRKSFCERQVREGIEDGATQVLVLGAGYDTLGWRLAPEFAGVKFFEVDHPATARLKVRGIETMGRRENLHLVAEDLGARRLMDVLEANSRWDPSARAVFVAEGLVMYLTPDAVGDLFSQCASIAGPGSRIAFSYIPTGEDGRPDAGRWTGLMLWLQRVAGEPWLWSVRPRDLGPFLLDLGWTEVAPESGENRKYGIEYYAAATSGEDRSGRPNV